MFADLELRVAWVAALAFSAATQALAENALVPLHRGFDRLSRSQHGKLLRRDEQLDATHDTGLAPNEPLPLQREDHLMNRGRDAEEALQICFGR